MLIAVIAVRVMERAIDQIIDVIVVRYRFMPARRPMHMARGTAGLGDVDATGGIGIAVFDAVFIVVVDLSFDGMGMMQMPLVQVVDVALVSDRGMSAAGTVLVSVIRVRFARIHDSLPREWVQDAVRRARWAG